MAGVGGVLGGRRRTTLALLGAALALTAIVAFSVFTSGDAQSPSEGEPQTYAVGETVATFAGNFAVSRVESHPSLSSQLGFFLPSGRFVVVYLTMSGEYADEFDLSPDLQDDRGRVYEWDYYPTHSLQLQHGVAGTLAVNQTHLVPVVFDVPLDARGLRLTHNAEDPGWWLEVGEPTAATPVATPPSGEAAPALPIGETASAPAWDVAVTDVFATPELFEFANEGRYVAITVRVESRLAVSTGFPFGELQLVDEDGRPMTFHKALTAQLSTSLQNPVRVHTPRVGDQATDPLAPGESAEFVAVFYAPPDVEQLWLVPKTEGTYPWGIHLGFVAAMPAS